jgi:oxygen-dependent protoporphyrinogen oxidase
MRRPKVVVVGAGIAGLSAAHRVASLRPDAEVIVLEAADRVGGKLHRVQVGGAWVDVGAEAMLARRPEGVDAVKRAGLAEDLIQPLTTAALLHSRGSNHPLPARTLIGIPADVDAVRQSGVLSTKTIERIANEPLAPGLARLTDDVSVGHLVEERFGTEVVDRLVDPLLGGVYAGHARDISLQAAVGGLADQLSERGGSLLEATASVVAAGGRDEPAMPVFTSLAGGLGRLPVTMAANDAVCVRTSTTVHGIRRAVVGFVLAMGSVAGASETATDAVIVAVPASKGARLLSDLAPAAAMELAAIETASMVIVTLAFDLSARISFPAGSGILVPAIEGLAVKAMTFSSQKWPGVGTDGNVLLMRASLGRAGEEWALQRDDAELVSVVRRELATITGLEQTPIDSHVQRWGGALPQYAVGHVARVARVRAAVAEVPGVAVCGASFDGVGIPACIASAHIAADRIAAGLRRSAQ